MSENLTTDAIAIARAYLALTEAFQAQGMDEDVARFEARMFLVLLLNTAAREDGAGILGLLFGD